VTTTEMPLPCEPGYEDALIGMLDGTWPDVLTAEGAGGVLPEHFYSGEWKRETWRVARALTARGEAVNHVSLESELRARELLGEGKLIESISDITECANHVPPNETPVNCARKLLQVAQRRADFASAGRLMSAAVYETGEDAYASVRARELAALTAEATSARAKVKALRFMSDDECEQMEPARGIVGNILSEDSIAFLYAREGRWKTFLALDWCLSCATNRHWLGRPVVAGTVVYIAAEGARGIGKRIRAWKKHHGVTDSVPIYVLPKPVQLLDAGEVRALIAEIRAQVGTPILVVIDTLARSMAGGNENDTQDINAVTDAAYLIRAAFSCCVLTLHHSGKDEARGMRGSSALRNNADTVIRIVGNDAEPTIKPGEPITLRSEKSKEEDVFADITLTTQLVTWATDAGHFMSSLVMVPGDPALASREAPLTEAQQKTLDALYRAAAGMRTNAWRMATGVPERTFYDARDLLVRRDYVAKDTVTTIYTVTDDGREHVSAKMREDCDRTADADIRTAKETADTADDAEGENPGFKPAQPTADTAEPLGSSQFRSNGHQPDWLPCYLELLKQGMPEREATYQAMHELEGR
jgi:AAA domain